MFIAHIKAWDYSIQYGETLLELKATTYDEAITELHSLIIGKYDSDEEDYDEGYWDDNRLEQATLFEITNKYDIPLKHWYSEAEQFLKDIANKTKEEAEKIEYERLKKKFGQADERDEGMINCDGCPCLNRDYEQGCDCNLGYKSEYQEIQKGMWHYVSSNCQLVEITTKSGDRIIPKVIELS